MAPMGPVGYADSFGGFNQRLQDYYVERAKNNVGLIITGICSVDMSIEGIPANGLPCPTRNPHTRQAPWVPWKSCFSMYRSQCLLVETTLDDVS